MTAFTTIEFIMVIVIIGILALAVMPSVFGSYDSLKLECASGQLQYQIKYAQQLAVTRQVVHGVSFNPASESYFVYRQAVSNIVKDPATQKALSISYISGRFSGIDLVNTSFPDDKLEFNSRGIPSSAGAVTLNYAGASRVVQVEANTGRIL